MEREGGEDNMRTNDVLYFSPKYRFEEIDFDNKEQIIECFNDRVDGFYLEPAEILISNNNKKYAFSVGLICVATIDFLALISTGIKDNVGNRFTKWLIDEIDEFKSNSNMAKCFYRDFRNGLVHEGRIKNGGQFSYDFKEELINVVDNVLIINPEILLKRIQDAFSRYIELLRKDEAVFEKFKEFLKETFRKEFEIIGK